MTHPRLDASLLAAVCLLVLPGAASAQCEADGDVEFVCGPISPEDLIAIPDTPWVIVSSMADDGYLSAIDTRNLESTRLFPTATSRPRHDAGMFGSCRDMTPTAFRPHGVSLRRGTGNRHTLYVVRHGARESIEVFDVDAGAAPPTLTWIGCAVAPEGLGLNAVVPLPDGGFAATSPSTGDIWEWHTDGGWARVPGSEGIGPNGLEISEDGEWYYVAGYAAQSVIRLSRGQSRPHKETVANVGFFIDNVHWTPDGDILAAGHIAPERSGIGACIRDGACDDVRSRVAQVDVESGASTDVFDYPSNEHLILGTAAIQVVDEIWVGGVAGGTRIARVPAP